MNAATGKLLLIPVSLGEAAASAFMPPDNQSEIAATRHFVVETPKAARAQLKRLGHPEPIASLSLQPLAAAGDDIAALDALLAPALQGQRLGLLSDAGCPAIADPGARLVARAHAHNIRVQPLVGPCAITLALMASGLNGQRFAFHGYLPKNPQQRSQRLQALEKRSSQQDSTQVFIETPYRNDALLAQIVATCKPDTQLALACELNTASEWVRSASIAQWRQAPLPTLRQRPAMFLLLANTSATSAAARREHAQTPKKQHSPRARPGGSRFR